MKRKIRFGTAGIPLSTEKPSAQTGIERVHALDLEAMELEFVHGIKMGKETAEKVKKTGEEHNISLSVHGPYYINLNSREKEKQIASIERIYLSAKVGAWCGARAITFHPAYFQGMKKEEVERVVQQNLESVLEKMKKEKIVTEIKPETTGKPTQYGSLTELLELHQTVPAIKPYIDFSHLHARDNGRFKTKADVEKALAEIEKADSNLLHDLNMHMSGIAFSAKGEKNHLMLEDPKNSFPYRWVLECLHDFQVNGTVICESPNIEQDALLMQKYYNQL